MRIVFMGTADLSCMCLRAILASGRHQIVGVVTQPDRPSGRRLAVSSCLAKQEAAATGLAVLSPERVKLPEVVSQIRDWAPDVVVVVAYGQILPSSVLAIPPRGCINMHYSLLPRYRGAAPIQRAIEAGDRETGVTAMFMNERMDAGDIIRQARVPIDHADTAGDLQERLGREGARVLVDVLDDMARGPVDRRPQDELQVTFAPKLRKSDGRIDWTACAEDIYNRVRAFNPWPSCFCMLPRAKRPRLRVLASRVEPAFRGDKPGRVVAVDGGGPVVASGTSGLRLLEVQPEGGKRMGGDAYARGYMLTVGDWLCDAQS